MPEVVLNPAIVTLRSEIATQEARLQDTASNLGKNHPSYLRAQSELVSLKQKLATETQLVAGGLAVAKTIGTDKEAELRAAIAAQKKKLLEIRVERDQLAVLQRDVDAARGAYESVSRRYTETTLASQVTQANVSVLSAALVPLTPSSPKPLEKVMAMALALGVLLGIGTAFGLEMLNRRVRSIDDLAAVLPFPVLGVIARTRKPRRLAFWRRRTALLAR